MRSPLAILGVIILTAVLTAGGAVAAYLGVRTLVLDSPIELPPPPQIAAAATSRPLLMPTVTTAPESAPGATPNAASDGAPTTVVSEASWDDPLRVTVLLLGIDQRPGEAGPFRTDTMIVLSIDPVRKTAAMLSVPRDVYLKIPGFEANRINTANFIGENASYPGGGPALAKKTVETLLGIPIQRYVMVNFSAFQTIIDALGPVTVCPTERIFDDQYPDSDTYGVITVEFLPGCQGLDSTRLLQYARVRHNAGDDIGRAQRQQEVIRAVKDKALSLGGVGGLVGQAGTIWEALRDNVRTDFTFDELLQLARLAEGVADIQSAVLTVKTAEGGQLLPATLSNGDQVWTPVYEDVLALVVRLFDSGTASAGADPRAGQEAATLLVANGAGIDGLAKTTADRLTGLGFNVVQVGNAEGVGLYGKSEIRVYTGKYETARYLAEVLNLDNTLIVQGTDGPPGVDIQLIVGSDLAGQ